MTNHTWIYPIIVSIQLYVRKKCTSYNKYAIICDFCILSQGHALTISGHLSDSSEKTVQTFHRCEQLSYLKWFISEKIILASTNMCLCVIFGFCPGDMLWHILVIWLITVKKKCKISKDVKNYHIYRDSYQKKYYWQTQICVHVWFWHFVPGTCFGNFC